MLILERYGSVSWAVPDWCRALQLLAALHALFCVVVLPVARILCHAASLLLCFALAACTIFVVVSLSI